MILPFLSWLLVTGNPPAAPTPAPALHQQFMLPLANKTTATAVVLPAPKGNTYLVYATKSGKLGYWLMTPTDQPIPPDPIPPPPPEPTRLTIVIVENPERTTQKQRDVLADKGWRDVAQSEHDFLGILPIDLIDKRTGKPPPRLAPFLNLARGKELPWAIFVNSDSAIVWQGHLSESPEEFLELLQKHGGK